MMIQLQGLGGHKGVHHGLSALNPIRLYPWVCGTFSKMYIKGTRGSPPRTLPEILEVSRG